jgi:hypothetical protein
MGAQAVQAQSDVGRSASAAQAQRDLSDSKTMQQFFLRECKHSLTTMKLAQCRSIRSILKESPLAANNAVLMPYVGAIDGILEAGGMRRVELLNSVVAECMALGRVLEEEIVRLQALIEVGPVEPLCSLHAYRMLASWIENLRALMVHEHEQEQAAVAWLADVRQRKLNLFRASLNVSLAVAAPLHVGDPQQCPLCLSDFATGVAERVTLPCCDHKQSICRNCFVLSAFEDSNEATKTFAHCPFCRSEFSLYA